MPVVWAERKLINPMNLCFNPVSMREKKKKKSSGPCENSIFIIFNARKKNKSTS